MWLCSKRHIWSDKTQVDTETGETEIVNYGEEDRETGREIERARLGFITTVLQL